MAWRPLGTSVAMAGVMFSLILHFQYAYGWSPVRADLANLPTIVTMIAATPLSESLAKRFGHRIACLVGAGFLAGSLLGLGWGVSHGYLAIAFFMVAHDLDGDRGPHRSEAARCRPGQSSRPSRVRAAHRTRGRVRHRRHHHRGRRLRVSTDGDRDGAHRSPGRVRTGVEAERDFSGIGDG